MAENLQKFMEWNRTEIRVLRLKLGLSQTDFACKLSCAKDDIVQWEQGSGAPNPNQIRLLEVLARHAQDYCTEMQCQSVAEGILNESELLQVDQKDILDKLQ